MSTVGQNLAEICDIDSTNCPNFQFFFNFFGKLLINGSENPASSDGLTLDISPTRLRFNLSQLLLLKDESSQKRCHIAL